MIAQFLTNEIIRFVPLDHAYSTADPEQTVSFTMIPDPLDLKIYFVYMGSMILTSYVSCTSPSINCCKLSKNVQPNSVSVYFGFHI